MKIRNKINRFFFFFFVRFICKLRSTVGENSVWALLRYYGRRKPTNPTTDHLHSANRGVREEKKGNVSRLFLQSTVKTVD